VKEFIKKTEEGKRVAKTGKKKLIWTGRKSELPDFDERFAKKRVNQKKKTDLHGRWIRSLKRKSTH